jgi:4-amino-4-deoxy-L-arabinose transferase-like glycosyltransferase
MTDENNLATPGKWPDVTAWSLFGLVVLFFLVLKSFSFHWQTGDENVYFYMAWAAGNHGALPYGDYFFAHPPLHLLPGIILFGLFGFGPFTARLIPVGATITGAVFLFLLARKHMGRVAAVATVFLYLTAFSLLRASTHWTGINLSVMWVIIGLWAFYKERPLSSGVFMALGVCTGAYVLPGAIMAGLLALLRSRRDGLRYLAGFALVWGFVNLVCLIIGGSQFIDGVYRYHVAKPSAPGASWKMSVRVFTDNFALFLGVLFGPLLAWLDKFLRREEKPAEEPKKKKKKKGEEPPAGFLALWLWLRRVLLGEGDKSLARVGALWTLGYVIFIAMLARVFPFYFLLLFPAMALAGGYAAARIIRGVSDLARNWKERSKRWYEGLAIVGALLAVLLVANLVRLPVQRGLLPKYVRQMDKPMQWSDAPLPGFVNGFLEWCCWDDVAEAYQDYSTTQEILYHESRFFEKAEELAEYVEANTDEDQTIFGDSSTAGIVALLSGRRLAADFADTNTMRFRSEITSVDETIKEIEADNLALVLVSAHYARQRGGKTALRYGRFASVREFRRWLEDDYEEAYRVRDRTKGIFILLKRKP